jgi:hypothetical protein
MSADLYKKQFPEKCWPMKHFRNFSLNVSSDTQAKRQFEKEDLIMELLQADEETTL